MKTKQVPKEEKPMEYSEEQLEKVITNKKFTNLRGKLNFLDPLFNEVLKDEKSLFFGKTPSRSEQIPL